MITNNEIIKLANDNDFKEFNLLVNEINVFEILRSENSELKHSNFLAWLLNPYENHGLGSIFLKSFLEKIGSDKFSKQEIPENLDNVEIKREWKRIDITVFINENNGKSLIAIENKIKSGENGNQLIQYSEIIDTFKSHNICKLYLVPDNNSLNRGTNKEDNSWKDFEYSLIVEILVDIINKSNIHKNNDLVHSLIQQYRKTLQNILCMDNNKTPELETLCSNIWKKHKKALDYLINYKQGSLDELFKKFQDSIKQDFVFGKSKIWFKTKAMYECFQNKHSEILNYQLYKDKKADRIELYLFLGTGDMSIRNRVFDLINKSEAVAKFKKELNYRELNEIPQGQYNYLFRVSLIEFESFENVDINKKEIELNNNWKVIANALNEIDKLFKTFSF